jgi:hypothetical protein
MQPPFPGKPLESRRSDPPERIDRDRAACPEEAGVARLNPADRGRQARKTPPGHGEGSAVVNRAVEKRLEPVLRQLNRRPRAFADTGIPIARNPAD